MNNPNKLIIFDCDGVLVDSEPLSCQVVAEQMTELGIPMDVEEAMDIFAGGSLQRVLDFVLQKTGKAAPDNLQDEYRRRSFALFQKSLQPVAGVKSAIESIGFKKCVASNGPLDKIKLNLGITKLNHLFEEEHLFSAYDIGHWKPDPRLFLHAATTMGIQPKDCIVIEDSDHGVHAAKAAGMKVFGYAGLTPKAKLEEAGAITFNSMSQLPQLLSGL